MTRSRRYSQAKTGKNTKYNNYDKIKEMVENLGNKDKSIQSDCIKVLYEIGYIKPIIISDYMNEFTKLFNNRNNIG